MGQNLWNYHIMTREINEHPWASYFEVLSGCQGPLTHSHISISSISTIFINDLYLDLDLHLYALLRNIHRFFDLQNRFLHSLASFTVSPCRKSFSFLERLPPNIHRKWGPQTLAKLVNITPISLWFMVLITIVIGANLNQLITRGPHIHRNGQQTLSTPDSGIFQGFFAAAESLLSKRAGHYHTSDAWTV